MIILLAAASLCFYAYWDWRFLWVIGISVLVNYAIGLALGDPRPSLREKSILMTGIGFNLCLLGYFKYANFFLDDIQIALASPVPYLDVVLPLGISFFTFQQIAYLVDVHHRKVVEHDFRHYLLFVTLFPQLIAGPIVHHREMMPQFVAGRAGRVEAAMFAQGLAIFVIGVAKKVLIADRVARYATPVFDAIATDSSSGLSRYFAAERVRTVIKKFAGNALSDHKYRLDGENELDFLEIGCAKT